MLFPRTSSRSLLLTSSLACLCLASILGIDVRVYSDEPVRKESGTTHDEHASKNSPSTDKLGKKIANIVLQDSTNKAWSLYAIPNPKAVVVVFLSFECPVSNSYASLLADLSKNYQGRGVTFVGICADAENAKLAKDFKIPFVILHDDNGVAADAFKAEITPEAFLLDHNFVVRYRGRIDNGYTARLRKALKVTRDDLRQALDELLDGKSVALPATKAIGCPISRTLPVQASSGKVTFNRDVLPVLQNHCQTCHRPGEVAPFSLMTYRQAVNWASDIKSYTQARTMPPWKPVEGPAFHDERKMTDREIATLAAWADDGAPEGNPGDAPPTRSFAEGWQLGKPDLILL